jgi:acetyl esterase/lipase
VIAQLFRTGSMTIAWLLVIPCLIILFGAIVPVVPWLRIYAVSMVPNHSPWLAFCSLAGLFIAMLAHIRRRSGMTLALIGIGGVAVVAAAGVMLHLFEVGVRNGVWAYPIQALSLRDFGEGAAPDESRVYARPEGVPLSLDIYRPGGAAPGTLSPVMVAVHGGGFFEGSRTFGAANMRWYADRGWTVISVDYRLADATHPTWNVAADDVRCALAWTAAHAGELGIDINRLTLSGGSAGGSLSLAAAYAPGVARPDPTCGPRVPRVAAVIVKVPLIDPVDSWNRPGELRDLQRSYLTRYLGGSPQQYPARYAAVDLRRLIAPGNPPTLILGGAEDPLISPEVAMDFTRRSTALGNTTKLILFPYSGHDFNTAYGSITNQAILQIVANFMADHASAPAKSADTKPILAMFRLGQMAMSTTPSRR